jgi:O-antigen ligase/tetratricopeptide (TPR) repeat protein
VIRPPAARGALRRFSAVELAAAAIGLAVFAFLAWDQPLWDERLQLGLHLLAAAAIGAAACAALRGAPIPRTPIRIPLLALLLAIGVASIFGENPGLAALAFASSLAYAAMLPIALAALRRRPTVVALVVAVPTLALAAVTLWQLIGRRVAWYVAGAPGLIPPIRVADETTPFGSVAVPAFVLLLLVPVSFLVAPRRLRIALQLLILALGLPLTVLSGSRSAWIAIGTAALVLGLPAAWRRRPRLRGGLSVRGGAIGAAGVVLAAASLALVWPRLTAVTSLVYRERLWSDTLAAWRASPWIGIGPGTMPYARQAAGGAFPLHQPHSHDMALGVLGDAGVVGLLAALVLAGVFLWVAGPQRAQSIRGRAAAAVLIGIGLAGFFDDISFLPGFALLVVLVAAIALADAGVVSWRPLRPSSAAVADRSAPGVPGEPGRLPARRLGTIGFGVTTGLAVVTLGTVVALGDAAGVAYHAGSDAAWRRDWSAATAEYRLSQTLDPWNPAAPKSLAITGDAVGNLPLAIAAAERATALNAGDGASWTNLALLCLRAGNRSCALRAADRAAGAASPDGTQLLNTALAYDGLGNPTRADRLYVLATRQNRNVALAYRWPRPVQDAGLAAGSGGSPDAQLNVALARLAARAPIDPGGFSDPAVQALILAAGGDRPAAESRLSAATAQRRDELLTWDIASVLERHWGEDPSHAIAVADALRGGPSATPELPRLTWDVAAFRSYPLDGLLLDAVHLVPAQPWPWSLEAFLP